jgi:hypothetical protein
MTPEEYKIAYEALNAVWSAYQSDSLAGLLGSMRINPNDGFPMDRGALADWNRISQARQPARVLDLVLAYLTLEIERYGSAGSVPTDIKDLVAALRTEGSPQRKIFDSVVKAWQQS